MRVLLYEPTANRVAQRLKVVIESLVSRKNMEVYQTFDNLSRRLCQPTHNLAVAVLIAASKQDLSDMLSISDLIWRVNIILILPDREKDTIDKGHTLRPRFLTHKDSDILYVTAVLSKMLRNTHLNNKAR